MIAQVWPSKAPPGPWSDETRKFTGAALEEGRKHDGVEGVIAMTDPATGESLSIALFRDQAALDAFEAYANQKSAESAEYGDKVDVSRVYSEVIAIL
jgi:hypothetical protein